MAKKRKSKRSAAIKKLIVRSASGDLYVITETKVVPLEASRTGRRVKKIIKRAEDELGEIIGEDIPALASGVKLAITEVFGHD